MTNKIIWHVVNRYTGVIVQTYQSNKIYSNPVPEPFVITACKAGCDVKRK